MQNRHQSLSSEYPEIAELWDFEENGELTPDKVKPGSDLKVGWICPDCGKRYKASISKRTGKKPTGCPACGKIRNVANSMIEVEMLDLETGQVIRTFPSISEAGRELNISNSNISMVCKGNTGRTQAGGYGWRYKI